MVDRIAGRYGHRGAWLILLGGVWVMFGLGVLLDSPPQRPWVLYEYVPDSVQAAGWCLTGLLAIWQGLRGPATPARPDALGHVALYLMPAIRLVSFGLSFALWCASSLMVELGVSETVIGYREGWYAAAVWALVTVMLHHAASWPEPNRPIPHPPASAIEAD